MLVGGKLCGIVSERDLLLCETLVGFEARQTVVSDAMTRAVYTVSPETPLNEVASTMAKEKYGCAVVVDDGSVVGILTTVDVCRVLAELLNERLSS